MVQFCTRPKSSLRRLLPSFPSKEAHSGLCADFSKTRSRKLSTLSLSTTIGRPPKKFSSPFLQPKSCASKRIRLSVVLKARSSVSSARPASMKFVSPDKSHKGSFCKFSSTRRKSPKPQGMAFSYRRPQDQRRIRFLLVVQSCRMASIQF